MKNVQNRLFYVTVSILSTLVVLAGCGESSQKGLNVDNSEILSRSTLLSSIQYHFLQKIEELSAIYTEHNMTYEEVCNNGGTVTYNFSEELFPATLTYNRCSTTVSDANVTEVLKDGIVQFTAIDANRTVTFEEDFNHTVTLQDSNRIKTVVQNGSTLVKHYNISDQGFFMANIMLICDDLALKIANIGGAYLDNSGISPIEGNVIFSTNDSLKVGFHGGPGSVTFDTQGNIVSGMILYESGDILPLQISIAAANIMSLKNETMDVSPYLWR